MFDNPKKDLQWLEDQLLEEDAASAEDGGEDWLEEDWLDDELREAHALMDNDYSRPARREPSFFDYDEEEGEEELAVYTDVPDEPKHGKGKKSKKEKKPGKEKGIGGLVFLACLETLGIIAVLLWWVLWLL